MKVEILSGPCPVITVSLNIYWSLMSVIGLTLLLLSKLPWLNACSVTLLLSSLGLPPNDDSAITVADAENGSIAVIG